MLIDRGCFENPALRLFAKRYTAALDKNRETVFREQSSIHFKLLSNFGGDNLEKNYQLPFGPH